MGSTVVDPLSGRGVFPRSVAVAFPRNGCVLDPTTGAGARVIGTAEDSGSSMAQWYEFHGWMAFRWLDEDAGLARAFTIGYRFTDDGAEAWTRRFNRFKNNSRPALCGGLQLFRAAVPRLVRQLGLDASRTVFLPALSSAETMASENGVLSVVTSECARAAGAGFVRDAVRKKAHQPLHQFYNADRRHAILEEAAYRSVRIEAGSVLVFDDLITRGATLSHIAQAILRANPRVTVYGVGLAKTERRGFWEQRGEEISNDHVPEVWTRAWESGEAASAGTGCTQRWSL